MHYLYSMDLGTICYIDIATYQVEMFCFIDKRMKNEVMILIPIFKYIKLHILLTKPNVITNQPAGRLYPNIVEATGHYKHCELLIILDPHNNYQVSD